MMEEITTRLRNLISRSEGLTVILTGTNISLLRKVAENVPELVENIPPRVSDVMIVDPKGEDIGINEIRDIENFLAYSPEVYERKYVIVHECEKMTIQSANAFLKTLEEPPRYGVIIMDTKYWSYLLPTIRSRGVKVNVQVPQSIFEDLKEKFKEHYKLVSLIVEHDFDILEELKKLTERDISKKLEKISSEDASKLVKRSLERGTLESYLASMELIKRFAEADREEFVLLYGDITEKVSGKELFHLLKKLCWISEWLIMLEGKDKSPDLVESIKFLDSITRMKIANLNNNLTLMNLMIVMREAMRSDKVWS